MRLLRRNFVRILNSAGSAFFASHPLGGSFLRSGRSASRGGGASAAAKILR